jgi:hypothetical protein
MADFNRDRIFDTGADRSSDKGKHHPDRAWSPLVLAEFARYMYEHNTTATVPRREDQWQLGFPMDSFVESGTRHWEAFKALAKGYSAFDEKGNPVDIVEALDGVLFNVQGYLHQLLFSRLPEEDQKRILEHVRSRNPVRTDSRSGYDTSASADSEHEESASDRLHRELQTHFKSPGKVVS